MKALVTGASSGIGKSIAYYLATQNIDLILVSRNKEKLDEIKKDLKVKVKTIPLDLKKIDNVYKLYDMVKKENIDILVNDAGFGLFGLFTDTSLDRELEMINLNVITYHVLTKLFLKDFVKKDSGYILNVCSSAGFMAGPRLSTYYATKNYVTKLTIAINEELRQQKSNVVVSALCPGPVNTNFNNVALGEFTVKGLNSDVVAIYAINKMFQKKMLIIPGFSIKLAIFFTRLLPYRLQLKMVYKIQYEKQVKYDAKR